MSFNVLFHTLIVFIIFVKKKNQLKIFVLGLIPFFLTFAKLDLMDE